LSESAPRLLLGLCLGAYGFDHVIRPTFLS
jgi:hypothetical protein